MCVSLCRSMMVQPYRLLCLPKCVAPVVLLLSPPPRTPSMFALGPTPVAATEASVLASLRVGLLKLFCFYHWNMVEVSHTIINSMSVLSCAMPNADYETSKISELLCCSHHITFLCQTTVKIRAHNWLV